MSDALGYIGLINNLNLGPRSDTPYGKNALVRQALDAAIDRTALVNVVFNGMFAPNVQPVAAKLAILRRGADPAAARSGEGQGAVAAGRCDTAGQDSSC